MGTTNYKTIKEAVQSTDAAGRPMFYDPSVMSVKEARKKLGKLYKKMSDSEVENLVILLHLIAKETIQNFGSKIIY